MVAGGILPTTIYNNKIYFLFGKERAMDSTPGWSDFAGGVEHNDSQMTTAIREGTEELTGFLGSEKDLKKMLKKHGNIPIQWETYRTHVFPLKYDPALVYYYNNNQRFLQKKLKPSVFKQYKIFEKAEIKWISFEELNKMRKKFRPFYTNVVDKLLENKEVISRFIRSSLNGKMRKERKTIKKSRTAHRKTRRSKSGGL